MTETVWLADGRQISVEVSGNPSGRPVFLLHGTPGSRLGPRPRGMVLYRLGVRLITFDRPGYGHSDRMPGRRVADVANDVAAIADGLDWFDGMTASNVVDFTAAAGGHASLAARLSPAADAIRTDPASVLARLRAELPDSDRRIVAGAGIRALLAAPHAEALRASAHGWIDHALALCVNWGFDPSEVHVPVLLWHGESDVLSPASHARWLASRIPNATVAVQSGAAHFSALHVLPDVLRWLVTSSPPR